MFDKSKANKIEIKITKYNNYNTPHGTYLNGRVYAYTKNDPKFDSKLESVTYDFILDLKVTDEAGNVLYERDFQKEITQTPPDNHVEIVLYPEANPMNIASPTLFDTIDKIIKNEVKYGTEQKLDEALYLSKLTDSKKLEIVTSIKSSIKSTSSKEDYAVALSKLNGVHVDKLKEQYSRLDLINQVNEICNKVLKELNDDNSN